MRLRHGPLPSAMLAISVLVPILALTACSGATQSAPSSAAASAAAADPNSFAAQHYKTPLAGVCPSPLIVQKDWLPEVEQNAIYQLIGGGGTAKQNNYSGPLGSTGIELTILDGGPGLGDGVTPSSALYSGNLVQNLKPQLAYVYTDDAVLLSKSFPTVAVFTPFEGNPQGLMYDPATYPSITSVDDIKAAVAKGAKMYVTSKQFSYVRYLIGKGVPSDAFVEGYSGDKDKFVSNGGAWLNQGYESSEPYTFSHETPEWDKPTSFVTVSQLGLGIYPMTLAVAKDQVEPMSACLSKLVPMLQQAEVDYMADPAEVNALITKINDQGLGAPFWKTSIGLNNNATAVFKSQKLVSNGNNKMIGDFDEKRVQSVIDVLGPIFIADGSTTTDPNVKASDIYTNKFLDESIGLP